MIAIVDTGGANLASLAYALDRLQIKTQITQDPETIHQASHVILPGVGAAKDAMQRILAAELTDCLRQLKQPTLGVCLGMQLLYYRSEEQSCECLNLIPAEITRFTIDSSYTIPHMGWNNLKDLQRQSPLFHQINEMDYFYFVHSFHAPITGETIARCRYGLTFSAVCQKDNYFGVQFHPERSSTSGQKLLRNFSQL